MKNGAENTMLLLAAGCGVLILLLWAFLPVLSFVVVLPLFNINGLTLAQRFNVISVVFFLFPLFMIIAAVCKSRKLCLIAGGLTVFADIMVFVLKKQLVLNGNLNWLYSSAKALITAIGNWAGYTITEANIITSLMLASVMV